ncbi:MAG: AAA family ATPase [Clostridia bacterium]|nr:AAA family ATPase [Clostridia bacterium]
MAIVKPENMDFSNKNIIMIISGLPGVGKTTLALSAPDVLLIDADEGMSRVKPEHRKDSSVCKTYEEMLVDIKEAEGKYKTIVIDTCGALIECLKEWAMRVDKKASKASGGISLQGFGVVKSEFIRLSAELRKKFNVVFLFHESKEKEGDETFYNIVCEGAARTLVWQPADLGAHLHIVNGERMLGFTPTMNYNAKSAYGIKGLVKVPELANGEKNDFLARLFETVKKNIAAETEALSGQKKLYDSTMEEGVKIISSLENPEDVTAKQTELNNLNHALTSFAELKAMFKKRLDELNIVYNKEAKTYEYKV